MSDLGVPKSEAVLGNEASFGTRNEQSGSSVYGVQQQLYLLQSLLVTFFVERSERYPQQNVSFVQKGPRRRERVLVCIECIAIEIGLRT